MSRSMKFSGKQNRFSSMWLVCLIVGLSIFVSVSMAFFFASDFASSRVGMSGRVDIVAVGSGNLTIEDTHTSNLVVNLDSAYEVLIPGMPISIPANCKVYRSTTKPLLRAKLDMLLKDRITAEDKMDEIGVIQDMYLQLSDVIEENGWYLHTDSYYYSVVYL